MDQFLVFPSNTMNAKPYRLGTAVAITALYPHLSVDAYAEGQNLAEGDYDLTSVRVRDGAIFRYPTTKVRFVRGVSID